MQLRSKQLSLFTLLALLIVSFAVACGDNNEKKKEHKTETTKQAWGENCAADKPCKDPFVCGKAGPHNRCLETCEADTDCKNDGYKKCQDTTTLDSKTIKVCGPATATTGGTGGTPGGSEKKIKFGQVCTAESTCEDGNFCGKAGTSLRCLQTCDKDADCTHDGYKSCKDGQTHDNKPHKYCGAAGSGSTTKIKFGEKCTAESTCEDGTICGEAGPSKRCIQTCEKDADCTHDGYKKCKAGKDVGGKDVVVCMPF